MLSEERTRVTGPIIRLRGPGEDTELGVSKQRSGIIITITQKTNKYPTTGWRMFSKTFAMIQDRYLSTIHDSI